jgi:hypothetical protein
MKKFLMIAGLLLMGIGVGFSPADQPEFVQAKDKIVVGGPFKPGVNHARGHIPPSKAVAAARHKLSNIIHGKKLKALPDVTVLAYDASALGYVNPIENQAQCGDCYCWSGTDVCANAFLRAGKGVPGGQLSVQYILDNFNVGGCDGGDEWQVSQIIMQHGCPSLKDYPGSGTSVNNPTPFNGKLYKIATMVYCDPAQTDQGVASTQSMKNAIYNYGSISVAVAAGSWGDPGSSVMSGPNDGIDHAVQIVGWKTMTISNTPTTIWKMRNQWSTDWGFGGYAWVQEGSFGIGTEAYFVTVDSAPVPPGPSPAPTPVPPVPVPPAPVPPGPSPTPPSPEPTPTIRFPLLHRLLHPLEGLRHRRAEALTLEDRMAI